MIPYRKFTCPDCEGTGKLLVGMSCKTKRSFPKFWAKKIVSVTSHYERCTYCTQGFRSFDR